MTTPMREGEPTYGTTALAAAGKDSGPTCSRCGGSGTDPDTDSSGPPHCVRCKGTGKDSGEVNPPGIPESSILATDQSAGPNGGQNAAAQLRESLGAPSTTRWDEMLAMVRGMRASHSEIDVRLKALSLRVAEGLEAKVTAATVPRSEVEALLRELVEANSAGDCDRFALGAAVEWLAKDEVKS